MEKMYDVAIAMNDTKHAYLIVVSEDLSDDAYKEFEKDMFTNQHDGKIGLGHSTMQNLSVVDSPSLVEDLASGFFIKLQTNFESLAYTVNIIQDIAYEVIYKGVKDDQVMAGKNYKVQLPGLDNITLICSEDIPLGVPSADNFKNKIASETIYASGKPENLYHYLKNTYTAPEGFEWKEDKYSSDTGNEEEFTETLEDAKKEFKEDNKIKKSIDKHKGALDSLYKGDKNDLSK